MTDGAARAGPPTPRIAWSPIQAVQATGPGRRRSQPHPSGAAPVQISR